MSVRLRIDGVLFDIFKPPKKFQNAITSRLKVMANLNIAEKRLPQDGRIPLKVGGKDIDIRMSTVPTAFGERVVMRLQDRSNVVLELDQLGFSDDMLVNISKILIHRSYGILIVTGPTGSGKSTTLYASLMKINAPDINILTIEDPVEQRASWRRSGAGEFQNWSYFCARSALFPSSRSRCHHGRRDSRSGNGRAGDSGLADRSLGFIHHPCQRFHRGFSPSD